MLEKAYVGGIEGGATISTVVLMDLEGNIVAKDSGPSTNHYLCGMVECRKRIYDLVNSCKEQVGLDKDTPILALGLSLSGCEMEEVNEELVRGLLESYPNLSQKYAIGSDTEGSIAATSNQGGICCIAGTGSNTLLINPDGSKSQCGGWGYLLGDEGSAWAIAHKAIKLCFDEMDGRSKPPHSTKTILEAAKEYFKITKHLELLDVFYSKFDKAHIAGFCKRISQLALQPENPDPLSKLIFYQAGKDIARSIAAVMRQANNDLLNRKGGVHVLCVGSVWISWNLLKDGFEEHLNNHTCGINELSLMKIKTIMAVGAAYMAADRLNIKLPRDYSKNYEVFYTYTKNNNTNKCINK